MATLFLAALDIGIFVGAGDENVVPFEFGRFVVTAFMQSNGPMNRATTNVSLLVAASCAEIDFASSRIDTFKRRATRIFATIIS